MNRVYIELSGVEIEVDLDLVDAHYMYLGVILGGPLQGYEVRLSQYDVSEALERS